MSEVKTQIVVDPSEDVFHVNRVQDVEPILEDAKRRHNEGLHGSKDYKHAMSIPNVLVERYCELNGISYAEFMGNEQHIRRMLNDPELSHFRIWKGRV